METTTMLPARFADLEPFAAKWCLDSEAERYETRLAASMDELQALYDIGMRLGREAQDYLDTFDIGDLPAPELNLLHLLMSVITITTPVEAFRQPKVPDTGSTYLAKTIDPGP